MLSCYEGTILFNEQDVHLKGGYKMIKSEWHYLTTHSMILVTLVAIALIPAIYCFVYLSSMWNTYGKIDQLPMAVVNEDQPTLNQGKVVAIGQGLTKSLVDSNQLDFHKTSASTADRGLKQGHYSLVLRIPKDTSQNALTLLTTQPKKLRLNFEFDSGQNFIVSKMTSGVAESVQAKVSKEVTELYTRILATTLAQTTQGLRQMAKTQPQMRAQVQRLQQLSTSQKNVQAIASPIQAVHHDIAHVPNNGTGMAPFAIAIGLYVGGIALGTMYDAYDFHKKLTNGFSWWLSKFTIIGGVGILQATFLDVVLHWGNQLVIDHQVAFFFTLLLGAWLFLTLIFCLRLFLGGFGTWLVSIVLVLQLAFSGGLYPNVLLSPLAKNLNPWLPMTYLIRMLRHLISTNQGIGKDVGVLIVMIVGLNLLLILKYHLNYRKFEFE